jgi:hypothetical protein
MYEIYKSSRMMPKMQGVIRDIRMLSISLEKETTCNLVRALYS